MTQPTLTYIPFDDFVGDVRTLAKALRASPFKPDFIIGVGRGGLVPGTFMSHATGCPMLSVDYSTKVPDFSDDLLVKLAQRSAAGEKLLFIDDINDTGRTIQALRQALRQDGADEGTIRFAMLIDNIRSVERVDFSARQIDRDVTKDWFVFPWEAVAETHAIVEDSRAVPERTL